MNTQMLEIVKASIQKQTLFIEQNLGEIEMSDRKIEVGGDLTLTGSTLNIGEISGKVTSGNY